MIEEIQTYFRGGADFWDYFLTLVDIAIVAFLIYLIFIFIKGTKASKIFLGFILLGVIFLLGRLLQLETLSWLLKSLGLLILVSIPVVFQPELRRALEKIGRTKFISKEMFMSKRETAKMINALTEAVRIMADNQVGGIIVIKRKTGLDEYIEAGEIINADVSAKLILNIFFPNSPLHDGAIIIKDDKIAAAACTLPLADDDKGLGYGTRHRAAMGLTSECDAIAVVVSEESGRISLFDAGEGKVMENDKELHSLLTELLENNK